MSQLIDDVATYLQANSIGTLGTNLFEGYMPPNPDASVAVIETAGLKPDIDLPLRDPSFQILIRSTEYDLGRAVADSIRVLLHNKYNLQLVASGIYFYRINLVTEGGLLGLDENGRNLFSLNFQCRTRQTADGN